MKNVNIIVNFLSIVAAFVLVGCGAQLAEKYPHNYGDGSKFQSNQQAEIQAKKDNDITVLRKMADIYYNKGYATQAFELYRIAANMGDGESFFKLGDMYTIGKGTQLNLYKAKDVYAKACNLGYQASCPLSEVMNQSDFLPVTRLNNKYDISNLEPVVINPSRVQENNTILTDENFNIIKSHIKHEIMSGFVYNWYPASSSQAFGHPVTFPFGLLILTYGLHERNQQKNQMSQEVDDQLDYILSQLYLQKCSLDKAYGDPSYLYNDLFVLHLNNTAIIIDANDVNDFKVLEKPSFELQYYSPDRSDLLLKESEKTITFYECIDTHNELFAPKQ